MMWKEKLITHHRLNQWNENERTKEMKIQLIYFVSKFRQFQRDGKLLPWPKPLEKELTIGEESDRVVVEDLRQRTIENLCHWKWIINWRILHKKSEAYTLVRLDTKLMYVFYVDFDWNWPTPIHAVFICLMRAHCLCATTIVQVERIPNLIGSIKCIYAPYLFNQFE